HPADAPSGHPALRVRGWIPGFFGSTSCAVEKLTDLLSATLRPGPPSTRRVRGAPGRAARFLRALGSPLRDEGARVCRVRAFARAFVVAFLKNAGSARAALPGPVCGGEARTKRPAGCAAGMPHTFRRGRSPVEKPGRDSRTRRAE